MKQRKKTEEIAKVNKDEVNKNIILLADTETSVEKKVEILATVDDDFAGLPPEERVKVIEYLDIGELIGLYIHQSGHSLDRILESGHYIGRLSVSYRLALIPCVIIFFIGVFLVLTSKKE